MNASLGNQMISTPGLLLSLHSCSCWLLNNCLHLLSMLLPPHRTELTSCVASNQDVLWPCCDWGSLGLVMGPASGTSSHRGSPQTCHRQLTSSMFWDLLENPRIEHDKHKQGLMNYHVYHVWTFCPVRARLLHWISYLGAVARIWSGGVVMQFAW